MAAVDYFLQVQGILGESTNEQFLGAIDIESFSWSAAQTGGGGGGGGAGRPTVTDLTVVKRVDKASPPLFIACVTGKHIATAELVARRSDTNVNFLQYRFTNVLVTSIKEVGTEGELPLEEVALDFAKIEITYLPQSASGQPGPPVRAAFDFRTQVVT